MSAFFDEMRARYANANRFVARVRALMALHGISQSALADRSGLSGPQVNRWLGSNPSVRPTMQTMVTLDEALEQLIKGD